MASFRSFTAEPGKRYAAALADSVIVAFAFVLAGILGEEAEAEVARWGTYAILFLAYHLYALLARDGRTFGRTALDICVVSEDLQRLGLSASVLRVVVRTLPFGLMELGLSGHLVALLAAALLLAVEFALCGNSPTRQTLADRIAGSLVVKLPPVQPHRAPAAPMFSANDAEFGLPRRQPPDDKRRPLELHGR